jgi:hypothetical protein
MAWEVNQTLGHPRSSQPIGFEPGAGSSLLASGESLLELFVKFGIYTLGEVSGSLRRGTQWNYFQLK